jgi:hypothetical protein
VLPWAVNFTRSISINVDTQRVSNAEIAQLQNGLMTFEQFYSARGMNWKEQVKQRAVEEAYLNELSKEYGVDIARLRTLQAGTALLPSVQIKGVATGEEVARQEKESGLAATLIIANFLNALSYFGYTYFFRSYCYSCYKPLKIRFDLSY